MKPIIQIFILSLLCTTHLLAQTESQPNSEWHNRLEFKERSALAALNLVTSTSGMELRLINPDTNAALHLNFKDGATSYRLIPEAAFPEQALANITAAPLPPLNDEACWFALKRNERSWIVYLDDQPVLTLPELWDGPLTIQHHPDITPEEDDIDDYVQRLGSFRFEDDFMVPAGSEFPPTWEIIAGTWKLHSVTGSVSGASGQQKLARQPLPEKSPNFYTLEGSGTNSVVLAGEPFYSHYICRASVQHNTGTNGIIFMASEHGGYLGFTARTHPDSDRLILELWQQPTDPTQPHRILDAVQTELPAGQWLLLEAQLYDDRIQCRADNIEVIRRRMPLPPGGRFGLFANMPDNTSTRFDDVTVWSHEDQIFETPKDLIFATRDTHPNFKPFIRQNQTWVYSAPANGATNTITYGSDTDGPLNHSTLFVSATNTFSCALLVGNATSNTPLYRFSCEQQSTQRIYRLEHSIDTTTTLLDEITLPASSNRVTLALDALRPFELRAMADGRQVCFTRPENQPSGVLGVSTASQDDLFFTAPQVASYENTMSERFEKNPLYVNDPYMRHWASPEGQWITLKDGMTWFKGDIIGALKVRLPVVNGMELHLFVPEGSSNGTCRVTVNDNQISLFTPNSDTEPAFTIPADNVPEVAYGKKTARLYTIGSCDHTIWIGGDEILLAQTHLDTPPQGRRMRIAGMTLGNLSQTLVKRDNIFDTLFTESLFNWSINGGRWEVINRFYCEPTWSHMNGENADSLAALWSKYIFSGDFCIEFYAGMRMGWYERLGDLNLTVMSKSNSTSDGYTAIATGWDPDHSQLYSRLLRNGNLMELSTKYLVPRVRAGSARRGYQPLVAGGRDIHGAWYGMQLRRTGNNLQYIYDNEEVFNVDDPEPLQDGSLGIWTYRNSMMVARIKIAAESIKPRPFKFHPIAPDAPPTITATPTDHGLRINDRVAQPLCPDIWHPWDTVSHPNVRFRHLNTAKPEMHVTSIMGGGTFLTRCDLPPALPDKLLGWRFEFAHHPEARVNFEFSSVKDDGKGTVTPIQGWSYQLTGTDETRGPRLLAGTAPGILPTDPDATNIVWTPIEVWIPSEIIRANQAVQIDGFGNLQPSDVVQGLCGNPPHAWYAVRSFREIHRGTPVVTGPAEKRAQLVELNQSISSCKPGELQMIEVPSNIDPRQPIIEWAVPELANFGLRAVADSAIPGSILVTPNHPWPSPFLPPAKAMADAQPAPFVVEDNQVRILVPHEIIRPGHMTLALELSDGRLFRQVVPMRDSDANHPPVMLSLELPEGGITTFEERPGNAQPHHMGAIASIDYSDTSRGGVLKFANNGVFNRRLRGILLTNFDPISTPVLQFRYKGDPMAVVSMAYGSYAYSFSEIFNTHVRFSDGQPVAMDDTWRVWIGMPGDSAGTQPLAERTSLGPGRITIASRGSRDQTGLHSYLMIDDVACGPAVGPNRPFAFKADYADPDGVAELNYAIIPGHTPYDLRPEDERQQISWIPCNNSEVIEPPLNTISEGFNHLIVRARDNKGLWSEPADLPFVCSQTPPQVAASIAPIQKYNGSALHINITAPNAPAVVNNLRLTTLGTPLPLAEDNGYSTYGQSTVNFEIDWVWLLRNQLAKANHGDTIPLTIDGITDAAGNLAPPTRVDIAVNHTDDKTPPTIQPFTPPANLLWASSNPTELRAFFPTIRNITPSVEPTPEGHVLNLTTAANGAAYIQHHFPTAWDPEKFPWLTLSVKAVGDNPPEVPLSIAFNSGARRPRGIKDSHTLNLADAEHHKYFVTPPTFTPNQWSEMIIDVRSFMRDESTDRKETPDLTYITINFIKPIKGATIQLRHLGVMTHWDSDHEIPLKAYDTSGIKGMVWNNTTTDTNHLRPANIVMPKDSPHWFNFRISDRSGNLTGTWLIPLPPGTKNTKPQLKGLDYKPF